ncbi:hypothetical protein GCM10025777_38480 [Membranihabitans marinus]
MMHIAAAVRSDSLMSVVPIDSKGTQIVAQENITKAHQELIGHYLTIEELEIRVRRHGYTAEQIAEKFPTIRPSGTWDDICEWAYSLTEEQVAQERETKVRPRHGPWLS